MNAQAGYAIAPLVASMAESVAPMTFPAYRHLLALRPEPRLPREGDPRLVRPFGAVAVHDATIVGLILGEQRLEDPSEAEALSLYVDPDHCGRGVGTRLLEEFERQASAAGARRLRVVFMAGRPSQSALEHILRARRWEAPVPRMITVHFTPDDAARASWLGEAPMRAGLEVFRWSELEAHERAALRRAHVERPWITEGLEFWRYEPRPVDPVSSLGARYRGQVVGWVLTHRISEDLVRFTCSFMRDDLARRAALLPLLHESIQRLRAEGRTRWCTFATPVTYARMAAFVRRRCAPWATFIGETWGSTKSAAAPEPHAGLDGDHID